MPGEMVVWWEEARTNEQGDEDRAEKEAECWGWWGLQVMVFLSLGLCTPAMAACRSPRSSR